MTGVCCRCPTGGGWRMRGLLAGNRRAGWSVPARTRPRTRCWPAPRCLTDYRRPGGVACAKRRSDRRSTRCWPNPWTGRQRPDRGWTLAGLMGRTAARWVRHRADRWAATAGHCAGWSARYAPGRRAGAPGPDLPPRPVPCRGPPGRFGHPPAGAGRPEFGRAADEPGPGGSRKAVLAGSDGKAGMDLLRKRRRLGGTAGRRWWRAATPGRPGIEVDGRPCGQGPGDEQISPWPRIAKRQRVRRGGTELRDWPGGGRTERNGVVKKRGSVAVTRVVPPVEGLAAGGGAGTGR